MEIWQFWLGIGIILSLLGVIVAILVKKSKNKHRMATLQKSLNDLEESFKFLQVEMETFANKNLLTMEEKCEKMRELLEISDKKCIYIGDLLEAVDKGAKALKERNLPLGAHILPAPIDEEKLKSSFEEKITILTSEYKNEISTLDRHLSYLNNRVELLESKLLDETMKLNEAECASNVDLKTELSDIKREITVMKQSISEKVTEEVSKQLNILDSGFAEIAVNAISEDSLRNSFDKSEVKDNKESKESKESNQIPESNITELFPKFVDSPTMHKKEADLKVPENSEIRDFFPKGKELVVKEIMEKYEQGISIPQIASELKMCRSEIQLIIKMNERLYSTKKVENYGN